MIVGASPIRIGDRCLPRGFTIGLLLARCRLLLGVVTSKGVSLAAWVTPVSSDYYRVPYKREVFAFSRDVVL